MDFLSGRSLVQYKNPGVSFIAMSPRPLKRMSLILSALSLGGCAVLHSTQLGEIDSQAVLEGERFEIYISELGVDMQELFDNDSEEEGSLGDLIALFQMGPKTGNPVFVEDYSDIMHTWLAQECPSGQITGLMALRESANYDVISGEIVRLVGYCAPRK